MISPFQVLHNWKQTKIGHPLNYHLGELFHLSQGTQDISVKVHGFLPGAVCNSDQPTTARPATLLFSFVSSAVWAATFSLGTGGPWRRSTRLQQSQDTSTGCRVSLRSPAAVQGLGGPRGCVGGPRQGCLGKCFRIERSKQLRDEPACFLPRKQWLNPASVLSGSSALMPYLGALLHQVEVCWYESQRIHPLSHNWLNLPKEKMVSRTFFRPSSLLTVLVKRVI